VSSEEALLSGEKNKFLAVISSKKAGRFENVNCCYIDNYDHNHSPLKKCLIFESLLGLWPWSQFS